MAANTTAAKAPPGAIYEVQAKHAADLAAMQTHAADQMLASWHETYNQIRADYDALLGKIAEAKAAGQPLSPAWLYQQSRYKDALATTKREVHKYAQVASAQTLKSSQAVVAAAAVHAQKAGQVAMTGAGLTGSFSGLDPANLEHLAGFLADGSPLDDLLAGLGDETSAAARSALVRGISTGKGPAWMARELGTALDLPRHRTETIMRTETQRVYRSVLRQTYLANDDVLEGWVWLAHLDSRSCPACVAMDGTIHHVTETLDGHPRCRCTMMPRTKPWSDLGVNNALDTRPPIRSGPDWFALQPPGVQRAILGPAKYRRYADGDLSLPDVVARTEHPAWGTMRRERSLREIDAGKNANYQDAVQPKPKAARTANPKAAQQIADTQTLAQVENTLNLPGDFLTAQQKVDYAAAKVIHLNRLDYTVDLPGPDLAKAQQMATKMNDAILTKGYPSKGYSQVKAIYKAQANGTVGSKVGVIKSLTWEQKITAQRALRAHEKDAPALIRSLEKDNQIKAARKEGQALADNALEHATLAETGAQHDAFLNAVYDAEVAITNEASAYLDAWGAAGKTGSPFDSHGYKVIFAKRAALQERRIAYLDDYESALERRQESPTWTPKDPDNPASSGSTITIHDDGWGTIDYGDTNDLGQTLTPNQIGAILDGDWEPGALTPNPAMVKNLVDATKDPNGYLDLDVVNQMEPILKGPNPAAAIGSKQGVADWTEALAQAKATLPWKPNAHDVANLVDDLHNGNITTADAQELLDWHNTPPQGKANVQAALNQYEAELQQAAAIEAEKAVAAAADPWATGPDANAVDDLLANMEGDPVYQASLHDLLAQPGVPQHVKVNITEALNQYATKHGAKPPTGALKVGDTVLKGKTGKGTTWEVYQVNPDGSVLLKKPGSLPPKTKGKAWTKDDLTPTTAPTAPAPPPPVQVIQKPVTFGPPPSPSDLTFTGKVLGTHGAKVYRHVDGTEWLFKPPKLSSDGFLATLDTVASRITARFGLKTPDTFTMHLDGKAGSLQRMFDAKPAFSGGFNPSALSAADQLAIQEQHVMDWLLSNHDGHLEQFLRMPDGSLVGIDKGQSFRWFGQDRLDWDFHPNAHYGAPEPVYNAMYRDFAKGGKGEVLDPRHGPLGDFIDRVEGMSDDELKAMLRPYAEEAAAQGKLALPQPGFPGVTKATIPGNDVEAFLNAVVARKNGLKKDFSTLYDKAAKARQKALPTWEPIKPEPGPKALAGGKHKALQGAPEPVKPVAPVPVAEQQAVVFDGWLAKAEARYAQNPNKAKASLSETANWSRFERVIKQHDRKAVQELLDRQYLDQAMADEALALIDQAEAAKAAAERAYKAAQAAYEADLKAYQARLKDWREANGIVIRTRGMDDDVLRHDTEQAGISWGNGVFKAEKYTAQERTTLKSYTGSSYSTWNNYLRANNGDPGTYAASIKKMDSAMAKQPIPEDVILHRGTGYDSFKINGQTLNSGSAHRMEELVGTVQKDDGYMSTSVGDHAAFDHQAVQIKFRTPAGTPGAYVRSFSNYSTENELILGRGTSYYVHAVYKKPGGSQWIMEVEIVEDGFLPDLMPDGSPVVSPSTTPWRR